MMTSWRRRARGFTLVELMIVVAVIAILAAIAFPAYQRYAFRARRPDGQKLLTAISLAEERYYALRNTYADLATIGFANTTSDSGHYTASVTVSAVNTIAGQAYVATATPVGAQQKDACGALTLNNAGVKGQSGTTANGSCW
jgi:type IV pilus assembly protein PilE